MRVAFSRNQLAKNNNNNNNKHAGEENM